MCGKWRAKEKVERNEGRKTGGAQMWATSCYASLAQRKLGGNEGVRWGKDGIIFVFSERNPKERMWLYSQICPHTGIQMEKQKKYSWKVTVIREIGAWLSEKSSGSVLLFNTFFFFF